LWHVVAAVCPAVEHVLRHHRVGHKNTIWCASRPRVVTPGIRPYARCQSMCLARAGEDLQGLLPSKWCPQTPYPRPSAAPAGRKRPAQTGSRSRPKPRQAWLKPPAAQIENAGFSGSLGCQSSRQRGSCVPCTLTCGMTTGERVSKGGGRARVAVQTGAGKSGRVRGGVGPYRSTHKQGNLQGLPPKWCPQTPYPRSSTAPAGRKRPA
jgi:hypothetical protein